MDSNLFLNIKDKTLNEAFIFSRKNDILILGIIALCVRIMTIACGIIGNHVNNNSFTEAYWIIRSVSIAW